MITDIDKELVEDWFKLFEQEKYEDAIKTLDKAIEENPKNIALRVTKGVVLFKLERYEDAIKTFDEAIIINPQNTNAYFAKGLALFKLEEYEGAIEVFDKIIEIAPKEGIVYFFKGIALSMLGEYKEAIRFFNKAIEIFPEDSYFFIIKGISLYKLGKYGDAIKTLNRAIKINSKDIYAHIYLGELFYNLGNLEGASKEVKDALDIDGYNTDALSLLGRIKIEEHDYNSAIDSFKKAISLDVGNPSNLLWDAYANYLDAEFSQDSRDEKYHEKLVSIIRKLERVEKISENRGEEETRAYILYLLGYLYYKSKDIFTAKEKLEECVKLESKSSIGQASELLEYIWSYQIRPSWLKWWLASPLHCWIKRFIFIILLSSILALFLLYPFITIWFHSFQVNVALYMFFILFLVIIFIFPVIERLKVQDVEIEMRSPPPVEFAISPAIIEEKIKEFKLY